jgi:hypothetical protein
MHATSMSKRIGRIDCVERMARITPSEWGSILSIFSTQSIRPILY